MWKCGSRRFRDTVERSANHYDKCSSVGINTPWCDFFNQSEKKNKNNDSPCCWFIAQKCWNSFNQENDTKHKRWNFEHLNRTWIGAIAWSSALMFGWYTSHLIHLNFKKNCKDKKKFCIPKVYNLLESLPTTINSQKCFHNLDLTNQIEKFLGSAQVVHAVSNDHSTGGSSRASNTSSGIWINNSGPLDSELGDVLNSIENRLGLAEIESGHYQNGLNLLRSAANRNHAPAIYNLALCYEMGLGVAADEKIAMSLYRTAASLHHPGALYNLGIYYGQGRGGLTRDRSTALRLLKLAAVQGQEDAITAIKALDPDSDTLTNSTNTTNTESSTGSDISKAPEKNDAPTLTSLFIQNLQLQQFNYEPIVF